MKFSDIITGHKGSTDHLGLYAPRIDIHETCNRQNARHKVTYKTKNTQNVSN